MYLLIWLLSLQTCTTAEEKNAKMLELLSVRGSSVLPRFCDALQLSNHNFLAEFLRDEVESRTSGIRPETSDVFRKFPKLDKLLSDHDKDELINFLSRKMKEEVIRQGWRREPTDKEKALDAKQRQLEESFRSKEILKEKEEQIEKLQHQLIDATMELGEKSLEIRHLTNYIDEVRSKNEKELETQILYNVANEKSLRRLTERERDVNKHLQEMTSLMEANLTKYGYRHKDARERGFAISNISKAKSTLNVLLKTIDEYELIKTKCRHLLDERRYVLKAVGGGTGNLEKDVEEINLINVIKGYTLAKEDSINELKHDLTTMTDKHDAINDKVAHTDAMKDMLNNCREDIVAKEAVITDLTEENEALKEQLLAARNEPKPKKSVSFPSPTTQGKPFSIPSPTPKMKSVQFMNLTQQKTSVSFRSPTPQKKSVSFPSPTPSNISGQLQKQRRMPFKQARPWTPIAQAPVSESDSGDYDDESVHTELPPSPIPQLKLPTTGPNMSMDSSSDSDPQMQKMKVQFNLPTNHNQRLSAVLAQGMYLPPLMKHGMDLRISGPSGPMAMAKTLNAANTKVPSKNSKEKQTSFNIGGTGITNGYQQRGTSLLFGGGKSTQRSKGQAKVLRVSSLASSNKISRRPTNSNSFTYQAPYGQPYQTVPLASNGRSMGRKTSFWKS